ncbi:MAG: FAD-dependent oxidoreductase [Candidatus Nanopelagicales bacterium]|nr:FAD-dependent oxidoreductase [Candidatus Nanopelagicales bacterium]
MPYDVVVIGAGLAGLAAARQLCVHGLNVLVLESGEDVGGRVRTDRVDGYLFDRGFQLYNPAYPESARVLDHEALRLRPLTAGVVVAFEGGRTRLGDPRTQLGWVVDSAAPRTGSLPSKARFARYALRAARAPARSILLREDTSSAVALRAAGVDDALFDKVLRPFLAGVFLEPDLQTSRRFMDLILKSFVTGTPAVPSAGMQAIPEQLRDALPAGTVRCNTTVTKAQAGLVVTEGGEFRVRAVVIATNPNGAKSLNPSIAVPLGRSVTTWYHLATQPGNVLNDGAGVLVVDGENRGPVLNSVVLTNAAPSYAPAGQVLISSSALGANSSVEDEQVVRTHLAAMYGVDTKRWEPLAQYAIPYALPAMLPPLHVPKSSKLTDGLFICGDYRETASIQGAMISGRRAADAVLTDLGVR